MMKEYPLTWKTYRDLRWVVLIGLAVILIPSLIDGWTRMTRMVDHAFSTDAPSGFVVGLGAVLGILIAVVLTCTDLREPLASFWLSKPVRARRFILVKFFGGLAALFAVCVPPMMLEALTSRYGKDLDWYLWFSDFSANVLWATSCVALMVYSASFLIGCVNRNAVTTSLLSLGAGLLIYFAPLLVPAISFMSSFEWMESAPIHLWPVAKHYISTRGRFFFVLYGYGVYVDKGYVLFAVGSLLFSGLALLLSLMAVQRNFVMEAHQRTICWSIVGIVLLLSLGVSNELGTNMTAELVPLPGDHGSITSLHSFGDRTFASIQSNFLNVHFQLHEIDTSGEPTFTKLISVIDNSWRDGKESRPPAYYPDKRRPFAWTPKQPNRVYTFIDHCELEESVEYGRKKYTYRRQKLELVTIDLDRAGERVGENRYKAPEPVIDSVDMSAYFDITVDSGRAHYLDSSWPRFPSMSVHGNRLFVVFGPQKEYFALVFDVSGGTPEFIEKNDRDNLFVCGMSSSGEGYQWTMSPIDGLTREENLQARITYSSNPNQYDFSRNILVKRDYQRGQIGLDQMIGLEQHVITYPDGVQEPSKISATFKEIGSYKVPLLFRLLGNHSKKCKLRNGLLFDLTTTFSDSLLVYDVSDPERIHRVGHYAASNDRIQDMLVLSDGRVLLGGMKLHVLQPPKARPW